MNQSLNSCVFFSRNTVTLIQLFFNIFHMILGLIFTRAALTTSSFEIELVEIWIMKSADIANNKCYHVEVWLYCPGTTGCGAFPGTIETTPLPARQ